MSEQLGARPWDPDGSSGRNRSSGRNGSIGSLEMAMERGEWELAALYIIAGFFEAASKLPEGALEEALDMIGLDTHPQRKHRRRRGGRRHGPA